MLADSPLDREEVGHSETGMKGDNMTRTTSATHRPRAGPVAAPHTNSAVTQRSAAKSDLRGPSNGRMEG